MDETDCDDKTQNSKTVSNLNSDDLNNGNEDSEETTVYPNVPNITYDFYSSEPSENGGGIKENENTAFSDKASVGTLSSSSSTESFSEEVEEEDGLIEIISGDTLTTMKYDEAEQFMSDHVSQLFNGNNDINLKDKQTSHELK